MIRPWLCARHIPSNHRTYRSFWDACWSGDTERVQRYLEQGVVTDPGVIQCGLRYALWEFGDACRPLLLNAGARIGLVETVQLGNIEALSQVLGEGAPLNGEPGDVPPLVVAYQQCCPSLEMIFFLLEAGADVNGQDTLGNTALMYALWWDRKNLARSLLDRGADVNLANHRGETPLMQAIRRVSGEAVNLPVIVEWLLDAGADVNPRNRRGDTALRLAIQRDDPRIIRMLKQAGAQE
jgi:hypothetical protein